MKPPYFLESVKKVTELRVIIAKVVIWSPSTPARLIGHKSGPKAGKSDGIKGKLEHFWTTFCQECVLDAALSPGSDQQ